MVEILLWIAAMWLIGGWLFDCHERRAGMDLTPEQEAEVERLVQRGIAPMDGIAAYMERIHAQMVADGLFRNPQAHDRLGDV